MDKVAYGTWQIVQISEINKQQTNSVEYNVVQRAYLDCLKWQGVYNAVQVTGACLSVCVWVCVSVCVSVWVSECECECECECGGWWVVGGGGGVGVRVQWFVGVREGRGGKDGREFSFLTAWWMKLSFSLLVLAWRTPQSPPWW